MLAAGASTRLGQPKQLLLHLGEPLLRRAVQLALSAAATPVLAVVNEQTQAALERLPVTIVLNPNPSEGMGSSLRLGMAALAVVAPDVARVLLLVCDQPLLRPEHLHALLAAPGPIAAAAYNGRLGVPAVFAREHFPALAATTGDQGARALFRSHPVTPVLIPEAAFDIDTPEDLRAFQAF